MKYLAALWALISLLNLGALVALWVRYRACPFPVVVTLCLSAAACVSFLVAAMRKSRRAA